MKEKTETNFFKSSPEGCFDILPDDHVVHTLIKKVIRRRCRQAGIIRITPCVFENSEIFKSIIGKNTDIVNKELFTINNYDKTYALRPELTVGIIRSYLEHNMNRLPVPVRLYAFESVFRKGKPTNYNYQQFYQWSTEIIGEKDSGLDAQMIHLAYQVLKDLHVEKNLVVKINTLGNPKEKNKYQESLKNYFYGKERNLCFDCQERLESSPLRILDCKEEDCKLLSDMAPKIKDFISEDSQNYFNEILELLDEVNIPYEIDSTLVRGMDYYNDTVFEIVDKDDDNFNNSLIGGGRYDTMIEKMGGKPTPSFGFAMGVDRVMNRMKDFGFKVPHKDKIYVYVAQLGKEAKRKCLKLLENLHNKGVHAMGALGTGSIKSQLAVAEKFSADFAVLIGQMEVKEGVGIIRNIKAGTQERVPFDKILDYLVDSLGEKVLEPVDFYELTEMLEVDDFGF
jgi:histidyl-tRNA synthetase